MCGPKQADINVSATVAMREIGKDHAALTAFCRFMNLPPPMQKKYFHDILEKLHVAYKQVALESMNCAATEIREKTMNFYTDNASIDITVSCLVTVHGRNVVTVVL